MPDKQNENKFMAMLERKGIVRKADSDEEPAAEGSETTRSRADADLRSLLGPPDAEFKNVTPAARQPVPGMVDPVMPSERPTTSERLERPVDRGVASPLTLIVPNAAQKKEEPEQPRPQEQERPRPVEVPKHVPLIVSVDPFKEEPVNAAKRDDDPVDAPSFEKPPEPPPLENYTERYLEIDELYNALALKLKKTDTIYLVEDYLKTLPDSLPEESRREIVGKIVAASGFDYDQLMGDGVLRVKMLKEYAERFARHTDEYVTARQAELDELDQQILRIRRLIEHRRELHKKQFYTIEAEAQRLKEILTFISG